MDAVVDGREGIWTHFQPAISFAVCLYRDRVAIKVIILMENSSVPAIPSAFLQAVTGVLFVREEAKQLAVLFNVHREHNASIYRLSNICPKIVLNRLKLSYILIIGQFQRLYLPLF